jgi:hypothetical protein
MEAGRPLCLSCATLDHLLYLARGDTALIRDPLRHSSALSSGNEPSRIMTKLERRRGLAEVLKKSAISAQVLG